MAQTPTFDALLEHPVVRLLDQVFSDAGHELYLVGGSVRDAIQLGTYSDLDFTTDARPDAIHHLLDPLGPIWADGKGFGMVAVQLGDDKVEVCTFRRDFYAPESRKPQVDFGDSIEGDLERRDLTINALAVCTRDGRLIDPCGGRQDLARGILRTPGDPSATIFDDPLRSLRAIRFAACRRMSIDRALSAAIERHAERLDLISQERRRDELLKIAKYGPEALVHAIELSRAHGVDRYLTGTLSTGAAALDLLRRQSGTDPVSMLGPLAKHTASARRVLREMKLPSQQIDAVMRAADISRAIDGMVAASDDWRSDARRVVRDFGDRDIELALGLVEHPAGAELFASQYGDKALRQTLRAPLPVNGDDFVARGLKGPAVGRALAGVQRAFLHDPSALTREAAMRHGMAAAEVQPT